MAGVASDGGLDVSIFGITGDRLWGPERLAHGIQVDSLLALLTQALGRPCGSAKLLQGERCLQRSDTLGAAHSDSLALTLVFVDSLPPDARVFGDLVLSGCSDGKSERRHDLVGRNLRSGESLSHSCWWRPDGTISRMILRLGSTAVCYSEVRGASSLALQSFPSERAPAHRPSASDSEDSDAELCEDLRVILAASADVTDRDEAALVDARQLACNLLEAARWPPARDGGRSFQALLEEMLVPSMCAQTWRMLWMPWLRRLSTLQSRDLLQWLNADCPDSLSATPEPARTHFQTSIDELA